VFNIVDLRRRQLSLGTVVSHLKKGIREAIVTDENRYSANPASEI
jgi:hypothetical protein